MMGRFWYPLPGSVAGASNAASTVMNGGVDRGNTTPGKSSVDNTTPLSLSRVDFGFGVVCVRTDARGDEGRARAGAQPVLLLGGDQGPRQGRPVEAGPAEAGRDAGARAVRGPGGVHGRHRGVREGARPTAKRP